MKNYRQLVSRTTDQPGLDFPILGALLLPNTDGTLLDIMCWVVRALNPGLSDQQIMSDTKAAYATGTHRYFLIPGLRSSATLSPIAETLAAVIAWGQWTNPRPTHRASG